jgi:ElaA protein
MTGWRFARLDELTAREVHDILQARSAVFVVEQACVFQDMDGADPESWHLFARLGGQVAAYCRLVPPGVKFAEPSIGRVITVGAARGTGAGRALLAEALARSRALWPRAAIRIGAQLHLERFYGRFGFVKASEPYDEDGIAHIEMLRPGEDA